MKTNNFSFLAIVATLLMAFSLTACNTESELQPTVLDILWVKAVPSRDTLATGDTFKVDVIATRKDMTTENVTSKSVLTCVSGAERIGANEFRATEPGAVVVNAYYENEQMSYDDNTNVWAKNGDVITGLLLTPSRTKMRVGQSVEITVSVVRKSGKKEDVTPDVYFYNGWDTGSWFRRNSLAGFIASKAGHATVKATYQSPDGDTFTGTCEIEIE